MANTVTKNRDLLVYFNNDSQKWDEVLDPSTDIDSFIAAASDITVTDEDENSQEYLVVFAEKKERARTNYIGYKLEYWLKNNLGSYVLDFIQEVPVTKNNYVDVTDPLAPVWLVGSEVMEDDLDNEILNEDGESYDPKQYEQKRKGNTLTENNFFVKTFGIPEGGQFSLQYGTILNQSLIKLS